MSRNLMNEESAEQPARLETEEAVMMAARAAADKKAADMIILDLRDVAQFTEFFLICTANNPRQVQAVTDAIEESLRQAGKRPTHIEGYAAAEWVLLDYGDFIAHVFSPASRRFYDLERLWRDAKPVPLPDDAKA
ncbi:MAG: ribosome silencing factor [Blastocatellia bacterium]